MDLKEDYWTGSINDVKDSLIRSVAQYVRHYSVVKVGITNDPKRRCGEHLRSGLGWKHMVVKYKTSSVNFVNQLETVIVDHHFDRVANERSGGGGPNGSTGPYYLYVIVK